MLPAQYLWSSFWPLGGHIGTGGNWDTDGSQITEMYSFVLEGNSTSNYMLLATLKTTAVEEKVEKEHVSIEPTRGLIYLVHSDLEEVRRCYRSIDEVVLLLEFVQIPS